MDKFKAALDTNAHKAEIDADAKAGNDAGISGTPAFVINGYYISGAQPAEVQEAHQQGAEGSGRLITSVRRRD